MKVLIAEDSPVIQNLLQGLLTRWRYDVVVAHSGDEAWNLLQREAAPQLAILDWMMPGLDGIEICRRVRALSRSRYVYIILLSARSDQDDIVAALDAGADDYITKPFHAGELRARIRAAVRVIQLEEDLARQAHHDPLTGLPNRVLLADRLEQALHYASRHSERVGFFCIDLDRFKEVNDSLGHAVGDLLLRELALRLKACLREGDTLARVGGDEFALVAGGLKTGDEAAGLSARILAALEKPFEVAGHSLRVSASIGVTIYPDDGLDMNRLQQNADAAMYASKKRSRNGFQFYHQNLRQASGSQLEMERKLACALEAGEITLHYQPVFRLADGRMTAAEALLRWNNRDLGAISPQVFIPLAEATGSIIPIGEWALAQACRQASAWARRGWDLDVSVNASAVELARHGFVSMVRRTIEATGADPRRLKLEVSELLLMRDFENVAATLRQIQSLGIQIWIDHFGAGYSCFSYLHRLPVNAIKIAGAFVQDIGQHPEVLPLIRGIVTLAHGLGLQTVAAAVETRQQFDALRTAACDQAQGFLLARPRAPEDLDWETLRAPFTTARENSPALV